MSSIAGTDGENGQSPPTEGHPPRMFDPRLLEFLVCPLTKTSLAYDAERQELISRAARLAYPIKEGIPYLTREEARGLED